MKYTALCIQAVFLQRTYALLSGTGSLQDPTHVNIITENTHIYFTGDNPLARMYGFTGNFFAKSVHWSPYKDASTPLAELSFMQRFRRINYKIRGKFSHMVWELIAI